MGCGTSLNNTFPSELGEGKCIKSWKILNPNTKNLITLDLNETEEEGITEVGNPDGGFSIHRIPVHITLDCVMKGNNFRKTGSRNCKDSLFVIKKEKSTNFAVCVLNGLGK
jgi:hypothetical protein